MITFRTLHTHRTLRTLCTYCHPLLFTMCLATAQTQDALPATLHVADGFTVELVATPPLVQRPVALALDDSGALYVTDSSGNSPHGKEVLQDTGNRVLRLIDDDGDGHYDRAIVFADGLTFPEGCLWLDGSLYVGTTPTITKLTDTDGDGVADRREIWYDGKTLTGCANDLHGPYLGADGMIYWCKGAFDKQTHDVDGQPWSSRAAHIFRCRPDGSRFEPVMTGGMDNPVDVVQTSRGQRIFTTTFFQNPEAGHRDGLIHAVHGGVWGKDHDVLRGHRRTGDLMPVLAHFGAAAPCGLTVLESTALGDNAPDNLISCQFNLHKVGRHVLSDQGSSLTTRDQDLLWSTSIDFHPTDVIEDADGSLLIADTGAWYKICCPTSQLAKPDVLGAIYRVRRIGAPVLADPRGLKLDWTNASAQTLTTRLNDPRPAVRRRATQSLAAMEVAAVPALADVLRSTMSAATRRAVLWTLARSASADARAANRIGLIDTDTSVQEVACLVAALWRDAEATSALLPLLRQPHAGLRRVAAEAIGRCAPATKDHVLALTAALQPSADRFLEHAVIFAQQELLLRLPPDELPGIWQALPTQNSAADAATWRALLIAVDQALPERLEMDRVVPLLNHTQPLLAATARWIIAHRPQWGEGLVGYLSARLRDAAQDQTARLDMQNLLTQLSSAEPLVNFLATAPLDATLPLAARATVLAAMADVSVSKVPAKWGDALASVLSGAEPTLVEAAITVALRLPFTKSTGGGLGAALRLIGDDTKRPNDQRLRAVAAVPGGVGEIDDALFTMLTTHVNPSGAVITRSAAVRALTGATLSSDQKQRLLIPLRSCGPMELGRLLPLYGVGAGNADEALGLALIQTLRTAKAGVSLRTDQVRSATGSFPPAVQDAANMWLASLNQKASTQAAHLDDLLRTLPAGDQRRGQELFASPRAACTTCHTIGYLGGRIGPDLTGVGKVRSRRDLLEAVVYPSASFVRSYEPWMITTTDGQIHLGNIKNEGADFIVLNVLGGLEVRIERALIRDATPSPTSLMPAGFDQLLTSQELADLLAFLESRKG